MYLSYIMLVYTVVTFKLLSELYRNLIFVSMIVFCMFTTTKFVHFEYTELAYLLRGFLFS